MRFSTTIAASLAFALALAACSDGPTSPPRQVLAGMEASAGNGQSAPAGEPVAIAPAVKLTDSRGKPVNGVAVDFVVTRGGGSVERTRALSDPAGIATAGRWTLGTIGVNEVEARVGKLPTVRFTATALGDPVPPLPINSVASEYRIDVRFVSSVSQRQADAVMAAAKRWSSVIVGDLADVPLTLGAGECFAGQPALSERVDDLLLYVEFVPIDGPGQVLGESGPCLVRTDDGLPLLGYLKLDTADLLKLEQSGTIDDVVLHEMGHVLGIGTLWSSKHLLSGEGTADPRFIGARAIAANIGLGATTPDVDVENTGGTGTRDGHWRETTYGNELMTGFIGGVPNPLSVLTVASLQDLGYGATSSGATGYTLGAGTYHITTSPVDLRGRERLHHPKYRVDHAGRKERIGQATSPIPSGIGPRQSVTSASGGDSSA